MFSVKASTKYKINRGKINKIKPLKIYPTNSKVFLATICVSRGEHI